MTLATPQFCIMLVEKGYAVRRKGGGPILVICKDLVQAREFMYGMQDKCNKSLNFVPAVSMD